MYQKTLQIFAFLCLYSMTMVSQTSPIKRLSLKKEPTSIPADSLGTIFFYSVFVELQDQIALSSADFTLKSTVTDSTIYQRHFDLPSADGVYPIGALSNGLIKDHQSFFILLGNIKSLDPLILVSDFINSNNIHFNNILTNE